MQNLSQIGEPACPTSFSVCNWTTSLNRVFMNTLSRPNASEKSAVGLVLSVILELNTGLKDLCHFNSNKSDVHDTRINYNLV